MMKIKQRPLKANVGFFFSLKGKLSGTVSIRKRGRKENIN